MTFEMLAAMETPPSQGPGPGAPDDRATTFQPVDGGGEHRSGESLLVAAYSIIWTLLMVWLVLMWRRQARLNARLDGLEGAILAASTRAASPAAKSGPAKAEASPAGKLGGLPS